jgi:hypothetical protein
MSPSFNHKDYVPILKTKAGEAWALANVPPADRVHVTPLLELHPHKTKANGQHAREMCEQFADAWGSDPVFLDTAWLHRSGPVAGAIADTFTAARTTSLQPIPVVRLTYDAPAVVQVRAAVEEDGRGCMLRVTQDDLDAPQAVARIDALLDALGLAPSHVHLLLDYENSRMQLRGDVPRVPHLNDWLTFTAASGVFQASLVTLTQGTWHRLSRRDWVSWEVDVVGAGLPRRPAYGDYSTRAPGRPADFGDPVVNMRYTAATEWLVRIGGKHKQGAAPDIKPICASLVTQPEYVGRLFSEGDAKIDDTARPGTPTGAPQQWVQWSVSHHVAFVNSQIQTHAGL